MPTQYCECRGTLPYSVLRWVRAFGPRMQAGLVRVLQDRLTAKGSLSAQDVAECIGMTWAMLEADVESRFLFQPEDAAMGGACQASGDGRSWLHHRRYPRRTIVSSFQNQSRKKIASRNLSPGLLRAFWEAAKVELCMRPRPDIATDRSSGAMLDRTRVCGGPRHRPNTYVPFLR